MAPPFSFRFHGKPIGAGNHWFEAPETKNRHKRKPRHSATNRLEKQTDQATQHEIEKANITSAMTDPMLEDRFAEMNQVILRDLTFARHPRAAI